MYQKIRRSSSRYFIFYINIKKVTDQAPDEPSLNQTRQTLLQILRGRLTRHTTLTRALRELEMQRLLMGKGAGVKIRGPERVSGKSKQDEEDEEDAFGGRRRKVKVESTSA